MSLQDVIDAATKKGEADWQRTLSIYAGIQNRHSAADAQQRALGLAAERRALVMAPGRRCRLSDCAERTATMIHEGYCSIHWANLRSWVGARYVA